MPRSLPVAVFALAALSPLALIWLGAILGGGWSWGALALMALAVVALDLALPGAAADDVGIDGRTMRLALARYQWRQLEVEFQG